MFSNKYFIIFLAALIAVSFVAIETQRAVASTLAAPVISDVRVENILGSGAQIKWTTDQLSDSRVAYGTVSGNYNLFSYEWCDAGGNVTSHCVNLTGLAYNTVYYYEVKSMNASGLAGYSNEYQFTSAGGAGGTTGNVPADPYNLVANMEGANIKLTWSDPSTNKTETKIYRRPQGGSWTYLTSMGINMTAYTDSSVSPGTYEYQVFSCNSYGCSNGSNIATINVVAGATIMGKVTDSVGAAVGGAFIEAYVTDSKMSYGAQANSDGVYNLNVPAGSYKISAHPPQGSNLLCFSSFDITLSSGQTITQNFVFIKPTKTITGKVARSDGAPITDGIVNAWQDNSQINVKAQTNSSGNYTLGVTGGAWQVSVFPNSDSANWRYNQSPQTVTFAADNASETKTLNFTVVTVDAAVKGKILKPDGTAPAANTVSINLDNSQGFAFGASVDAAGFFSIAVPAGTYNVFIHSQDQTLIAPALSAVTVASGQTKDLGTITLLKATKSIKGKVARQDGRAVTDAAVGAFQKETQKWREIKVDGSGNYSFLVTGGSWEMSLRPFTTTANWTYDKSPQVVVFASDTTVEEKIVNFTVITTDAVAKGKILLPDETIPPVNTVFVGLRSSSGVEFGGSVDSGGLFRVSLPAGTYSVFIHSENQNFSAPQISSITIASGQTLEMGTIYLVKRGDHIKGKVADSSGKGISGVRVDAWMPEGSNYTTTKTDSAGLFDLLVTLGKWEVQAIPDPAMNFCVSGPPRQITVVSGTTATVDFILNAADAGISGTVVDGQGAALPELYGFASLSQEAEHGFGVGGPIERGAFSFKAPAGTYLLSVFFPPDSPYMIASPQTVILISGKTISVKVAVAQKNSKIIGVLKNAAGQPVTGFEAHIFATTKTGIWQEAMFDKATGQYTLKVAAGTWYLGYKIDPASGFISLQEPNIQIVIGDGETATKDLILEKAGSIIAGQVTDPNGKGVFQAFIGVSKTSFSATTQNQEFKDPIIAGADTDANGFYRLAVPAGSYFVKTFVNPERGFINSEEKSATLTEGQTLTLNLRLRLADLKITGRVFLDGKAVTNAFVWGWSQKGGYQETLSRLDGSFQLNVTASDIWNIAAANESSGVFYKSTEVALAVGNANVVSDIYLTKFFDLPSSVVKTAEATKPTAVEVTSGPTVVVPANAISTSGSVSISIVPDIRVSSQGEIRVVGVAYKFEARDASGRLVSSFNTDVVITAPYSEKEVVNLGASEKNLIMAFWDETVGTWKTLDKSVVNDQENNVTSAVNHFTRFAIVAAADIIPPSAPANIAAVVAAPGQVKLTWENPTKDFHHIKIYRSVEAGKQGQMVYNDLSGASQVDSGLSGGTKYYYLVRAVDPAGNESTNQNTVAVLVEVGAAKVTATLLKGSAPEIWAVNNNLKSLIRSIEVFNGSGYDWNAIQNVSDSALSAIPVANLIKTADSPDVYRLEKNFKRKLASIEIFESYNLDWNKISTVSQPMMDSFSYAPIYQKEGEGGLYWRDANNILHQFASMPIFEACGYNVRDLIVANVNEFGSFAVGEMITKVSP